MKNLIDRARAAIAYKVESARVADLCKRWRKVMSTTGGRPDVADWTDERVLVEMLRVVEANPRSKGRSAEEKSAATIRAIEMVVIAGEAKDE